MGALARQVQMESDEQGMSFAPLAEPSHAERFSESIDGFMMEFGSAQQAVSHSTSPRNTENDSALAAALAEHVLPEEFAHIGYEPDHEPTVIDDAEIARRIQIEADTEAALQTASYGGLVSAERDGASADQEMARRLQMEADEEVARHTA